MKGDVPATTSRKARDNRARTRTKAERYEEILAAAAKVFAERGFRASSIHDVAGELDITAAALYHYIDSKQDMLADICMRAGQRLFDGAQEVMALDLPPEEKLRALFHRHLQLIESDRAIFSILVQERSELPEARIDELLDGERAYSAIVRELLERLDPRVYEIPDARLAALGMLGMLNWVLRWYREGGGYDLDEVAEEFFRIFSRGIQRQGGVSRRVGHVG